MRKLTAVLLILLVGVAVVLLNRPSDRAPLNNEPISAPAPETGDLRDAAPEELATPAPEPAASGEREELSTGAAVEEQPTSDWPRCVVRGRVLDVSGRPIHDAVVGIHTVGEPWVQPEEFDGEFPPTSVNTSSDGHFQFELPLPSSSWISLDVSHPPYHTRTGRDFGLAGGRNEQPLLPGDNDLGDLVLADAGGFHGYVRTLEGAPIVGARVRLSGSFPGGYSLGGESDETGAYEVVGVPAGRYAAKAEAKGYVIQEQDAIDVENGRSTRVPDFLLSVAAAIAGRVIDQDGAPLAGVRLYGWPQGGGRGAGGRTQEDGSFRIHLPQEVPYTLGATLEGYSSIDDSGGEHYAPGREEIELVLEHLELATFRVVASESEAPVERFGLKRLRVRTQNGSRGSSADREPARVRSHEGGQVQLAADPRWDDYSIVAPGFGDQRGRVAWDAEGERSMTLELAPEGIITGRAMSRGAALGSPVAELSAARVPLRPGVTEGEDDIFSSDWGSDLDKFAGRLRQVTGDATGRFELRGLAAGTYELVLSARGRAPLTLKRVVVEAGEVTDLGQLEVHGPSAIRGQLLLGSASPAGISISLGDADFGDDETAVVLDSTGGFHFGDLAAGKTYLWLDPKPDVLLPGPPIAVELLDGETRHLSLDLADRVPCRVDVLVRLNGVATPGILVEPRLVSDMGRTAGKSARSDGEGRAPVQASGKGSAIFVLWGTGNLRIGRTTEPLELAGGESRELVVDLPAGRVTVELPAESGAASLVFRVRPEGLPEARARSIAVRASVDGETGLVDLGWLQPGSYTIECFGQGAKLQGSVTVGAGESITCTLRP